MTEIEIGANLTGIILQVLTVIIGYLSAKGIITCVKKVKNNGKVPS